MKLLLEIQSRYNSPDEAEADIRQRIANKEVIIGFGHPVYTISDPRNVVIKEVARESCLKNLVICCYLILPKDWKQ